jgi:hypothetical protein
MPGIDRRIISTICSVVGGATLMPETADKADSAAVPVPSGIASIRPMIAARGLCTAYSVKALKVLLICSLSLHPASVNCLNQ